MCIVGIIGYFGLFTIIVGFKLLLAVIYGYFVLFGIISFANIGPGGDHVGIVWGSCGDYESPGWGLFSAGWGLGVFWISRSNPLCSIRLFK